MFLRYGDFAVTSTRQEDCIMAKNTKRSATNESAVKRDLRTPLYRMRVVKDKTKYNRKRMDRASSESSLKVAA
jgi:hypothetical protein